MRKSEIITAAIAIYGAVLSTVALIRQWKSDRAKVMITVQRNMQYSATLDIKERLLCPLGLSLWKDA